MSTTFQTPGQNVWPTDRKYILINVQKELRPLEFMTLKNNFSKIKLYSSSYYV